jgi:hypothetical protein
MTNFWQPEIEREENSRQGFWIFTLDEHPVANPFQP